VILGFILYAVWTAFGEAEVNVDLEANAVVDMHHLAKGLPEPQRNLLQTLAGSYADTVITRDWPQMARGEVPEETEAIKSEMWDTVISVRAASATEVTAQQRALSRLSSLDQHRLMWIRQSTTSLPRVLWVCSPGRRSSNDHFSLPVWRVEYEASNIAGCFLFRCSSSSRWWRSLASIAHSMGSSTFAMTASCRHGNIMQVR
jgi:hypothetical protein